MKKIILILILSSMYLHAQEYNVMSYYASDNNLDGQPRIDMMNVMRFFPVFAIQDSVTNVDVTIYNGDNISYLKADKMAAGKYWQTILPDFKIGDAIQRVEVEMEFMISKIYSMILDSLNEKKMEKLDSLNKILKEISEDEKKLRYSRDTDKEMASDDKKWIEDIIKSKGKSDKLKYSDIVNITNKLFETDSAALINFDIILLKENLAATIRTVPSYINKDQGTLDLIISNYFELLSDEKVRKELFQRLDNRFNIMNEIKNLNQTILNDKRLVETQKKEIEIVALQLELGKAKAISQIVGRLIEGYTDSSYAGPAIRKSDCRISDSLTTAKLLYRYYKNNLRYRKALDPAEHLGIFRLRYIPFPVVATPSFSKVQLLRPMQDDAPVVFEVGLSFGDDVVSGNNTFNPAFSISRLGVAMIITEKLFRSDAEILGVALTYDFNSYASIGIGRNLAQGKSFPYYSFGINKKAFEQLLKALADFFE